MKINCPIVDNIKNCIDVIFIFKNKLSPEIIQNFNNHLKLIVENETPTYILSNIKLSVDLINFIYQSFDEIEIQLVDENNNHLIYLSLTEVSFSKLGDKMFNDYMCNNKINTYVLNDYLILPNKKCLMCNKSCFNMKITNDY